MKRGDGRTMKTNANLGGKWSREASPRKGLVHEGLGELGLH